MKSLIKRKAEVSPPTLKKGHLKDRTCRMCRHGLKSQRSSGLKSRARLGAGSAGKTEDSALIKHGMEKKIQIRRVDQTLKFVSSPSKCEE